MKRLLIILIVGVVFMLSCTKQDDEVLRPVVSEKKTASKEQMGVVNHKASTNYNVEINKDLFSLCATRYFPDGPNHDRKITQEEIDKFRNDSLVQLIDLDRNGALEAIVDYYGEAGQKGDRVFYVVSNKNGINYIIGELYGNSYEVGVSGYENPTYGSISTTSYLGGHKYATTHYIYEDGKYKEWQSNTWFPKKEGITKIRTTILPNGIQKELDKKHLVKVKEEKTEYQNKYVLYINNHKYLENLRGVAFKTQWVKSIGKEYLVITDRHARDTTYSWVYNPSTQKCIRVDKSIYADILSVMGSKDARFWTTNLGINSHDYSLHLSASARDGNKLCRRNYDINILNGKIINKYEAVITDTKILNR